MLLPAYLTSAPAGLFGAAERIDTWVLRVSIAIPVLCIAGLGLWQLVAFLNRRLGRRPRILRHSPEPPARSPSPAHLPLAGAPTDMLPADRHARELLALAGDDPEQLEQACTALADTLAEMYMKLGESWLRKGKKLQAAAAWNQVVQMFPGKPEAQFARDRLRQIDEGRAS
jgi:hypothetical protein